MTITVELLPFDSELRDSYVQLLPQQNQAIAGGKLEWKFSGNPHGTGRICVARNADGAGEIVGMNAFMRCRLGGDDGEGPVGYQSMDTIVLPAARGQGLFPRMVQHFYDHAPDAGFVYGFPNASSAPGFFGKLGWERLGFAPYLFRPLRTGYFLRKIGIGKPDFRLPCRRPKNQYERVERFGDWATDIWSAFARQLTFAVERDADYLNWRIADHPAIDYRIYRGGKSFVIDSIANKHGGALGYVLEAIGEGEELTDQIAASLRRLSDEGADAALAWCPPWAPNYRAYRSAGFMPLPSRLRPIEIHWGVRNLAGIDGLGEAENWYISYLDSDTV